MTCIRCGEVLCKHEVDLTKAPLDSNLATQSLAIKPHACETGRAGPPCPNGCGALVEIKNPSAIDTEFHREYYEQIKAARAAHGGGCPVVGVGVAFLLDAVCPICGYVRGRDINEEELEKVLKTEVKK